MDIALRRELERSVACVLLLVAQAGAAGAQEIRGRVIDRGTERPVFGAVVSLHTVDSALVASAVSDAEGTWALRAPRPGEYVIAVRRLGYRPLISGRVAVPVRDDSATIFRLEPVAARLDPVEARAAAIKRNLELNGFFERQKGNFGHFVTPEAIERRQAARITDLLTTIPGVRVLTEGSGSVGQTQVALRGSGLTGGSMCRPRVFVDGLLYARGDSRPVRQPGQATEQENLEERIDRGLSLDDIGHPSTIAGIEVYRSATQVPVQFGGTSIETLCGVIVIWTRFGRTPDRP